MKKFFVMLSAILLAALSSFVVYAQDPQNANDEPIYLITAGSRWRKHFTFIPPRIKLAENGDDPGNERVRHSYDLGRFNRERISAAKQEIHTPPPPHEWIAPDFDDSEWLRTSGGDFIPLHIIEPTPENYSAMLAADPFIEQIGSIAMRGKFIVNKPGNVENLSLSIQYRGGFVAYLNGREVARGHVPEGDISPNTSAEDYPLSAFVDAEGEPTYTAFSKDADPLDPAEDRWRERIRGIDDIEIDPALLREGVNVLAIQLNRSDFPIEVRNFAHSFAPIGLHKISLSCETDPGNVAASISPPEGLRVWNEELWSEVTTDDFADPAEPLRPMRIEAARNGKFSGMVMVGSTESIVGLDAEPSSFNHQTGEALIPAERIKVRYGAVNPTRADAWVRWDSGLQPFRFDALLDDAPATLEPGIPALYEGWSPVIRAHNYLPAEPTAYASLPVVITVDVPDVAPAGLYTGSIDISVEGEDVVSVDVNLRVSDWRVPDRRDYQSLPFISQDYDRLAERYGLEKWSEEHWRLIERSLERMADIGNGGLFFDILTRNDAPAEIIRIVRREDGEYELDFSRLERYLDIALEHHSPERIKLTVLHVLTWRSDIAPPQLTIVDGDTGEIIFVELPELGTPECEELLTPILHGIRDALAERGLDDTIMLGTPFDAAPDPKIVAMFRNILPEASWYRVSHIDMKEFSYDERDPDKTMPVGATSRVPRGGGTYLVGRRGMPDSWIAPVTPFWRGDPDYLRLHWNRGGTAWFMPDFPEPWRYRGFHENAVLRGWRGVGNICADSFGQRKVNYHGILTRTSIGTPGAPGLHVVTPDLLWPGPNGPEHTIRSLNMMEGVQEAEARVAVAMPLTGEDVKMADELVDKAEQLFEARTQAMRTWDTNVDSTFWGGFIRHTTEYGAIDWLDKNRRLFDLAAEIEQAQ